jgi:hypothetical protein
MGRPPPGWFRCEWTELPRVASLARVDDIEAARLESGLDDAFALVAGRFGRRKVRSRARACVAGMPQADPGEPDADRTVLSDFSATATTDQWRVRSFDHPHLTQTGATPA